METSHAFKTTKKTNKSAICNDITNVKGTKGPIDPVDSRLLILLNKAMYINQPLNLVINAKF